MNKALIETIKNDIQTCRGHSDRKGSQKIYGEMVAKYSQLIPGFKDNLSTNGKAAVIGQEFDYRPELAAIAAKLEMYLITENNGNDTKAKIDDAFISYAADVLGETYKGLSGAQIVKLCNSYAVDFAVDIPVTSPDFGKFGSIIPNKRTALYRNLTAFSGEQQYVIIKELCEHPVFSENTDAHELKKRLIQRYPQFSFSPSICEEFELTGWERVDRSISEMKDILSSAVNEEQFQTIGMIGRETLITVAQQVFDPIKHPTIDGIEASTTDAKRMLEAFLAVALKDSSDKARKFAKASVDLANQLTHDRNATQKDAELCLVAITSVSAMIKTLA